MYCPNCKSEIPAEAKFCPKCGFSIKGKSPEKDVLVPGITISPTITASGNEEAKVEFSPHVTVSQAITIESITKHGIEDKEVLERIRRLEDDVRQMSEIESADLRQLESKYGKDDLIKILESFRMIQRIKDMTYEDHKALEYSWQLNLLKGYTKGFDEDLIADLDTIIRRIEAELLTDENVPDKSKREIRKVCLNEVDIWVAEFLKG
jgi:hypothetical protein